MYVHNYLSTFKIGSFSTHTLIPPLLPLLETTLKVLLSYLPKLSRRVGFYVFDGGKTVTFEALFDLREEPEISRC